MIRLTALLITATTVSACGGGSDPAGQVRDTARNVAEAIGSAHPERACQYMVDHDACIGSIATANAMHLEVAAVVNLPPDWRKRLEHAKIKVSGDTATMSGVTGSTAKYVQRGGQWLLDNR